MWPSRNFLFLYFMSHDTDVEQLSGGAWQWWRRSLVSVPGNVSNVTTQAHTIPHYHTPALLPSSILMNIIIDKRIQLDINVRYKIKSWCTKTWHEARIFVFMIQHQRLKWNPKGLEWSQWILLIPYGFKQALRRGLGSCSVYRAYKYKLS